MLSKVTEGSKFTHSIGKRKLKWKSYSKIKKCAIMSFLIAVLIINSYAIIRLSAIRNISGSAKWINTNNQNYLEITAADSYSLGYLTGQKISSQIFHLKKILYLMAPQFDYSYNKLKELGDSYLKFIPDELIKEMEGLANGATNKLGILISFSDILLQNTWLDIMYGQIQPNQSSPLGCTVFAVKNNNTNGTTIIFGQNFDFMNIFKKTVSFVLHKLGNKPKIFGIKFGASLNLPTAKTSNNISILSSIVQTKIQSNISIPITCRTRLSLEKSSTIEEFISNFFYKFNGQHTISYNLVFTDNFSLYFAQITPKNQTISKCSKVVTSNTFMNSEWQVYLQNKTYSKNRQNLSELLLDDYIREDNYFSHIELMNLLKNEPVICRTSEYKYDTATLAFFTSDVFGLGNSASNSWGDIPIF